MNEQQLKQAYYLKGWKLFVWRYFINNVYPALKEGHEEHRRLIKKGYIAHLKDKCAICDTDNLLTSLREETK